MRATPLCTVLSLSILMAIPAVIAGPPTLGERPTEMRVRGVCPPFPLRDEHGAVIDPVKGVNTTVPYSPRQTCAAPGCHDYEKITQGYHFTQGLGEAPTPDQAARLGWVTTPGNFGGAWCSPAPLYRYLSPQDNPSAARMDMTAFDFFTASCASCHPGGGSAEHDRSGHRYDHRMSDPHGNLAPKAENHFDGDYYKARWSESGVLEADCLLCHLPEYDFPARQAQLAAWSFRWAATAGARLAQITGSVREGKPVELVYDPGRFSQDGTLKLRLTRQPRNETCLTCHAQPGWKKRGANYRARTDVHLRAGLLCVDCHPAGSSATDPRISAREAHQIGKGDDPGGQVRNDLDNTDVGCAGCHETGRKGAPISRHAGLPPLHLDRIACQTCHIPERLVMPAEVQASDVYNTAPWISTASKWLWTFYGPDWQVRNHYGFLEIMGYDDKPTEPFRPVVFRYKGKLVPGNRVHSTWPGIEIDGQTALMQPRMNDIAGMWKAHRESPERYPELARIVDNTGDGVPEINTPGEIDALIAAVTRRLGDVRYPLAGSRVVWVMNDRVYRSGTEYHLVDRHEWEASPFASTHTYNHDVYPARAALGSGGCTDCHGAKSPFLYASVMTIPFGSDGRPETVPQWKLLGMTRAGAWVGAWRESVLKPAGPWLVGVAMLCCLLHLVVFGRRHVPDGGETPSVVRYRVAERLGHALGMAAFVVLASTGVVFMLGRANPLGETARLLHTLAGLLFALGLVAILVLWLKDARLGRQDRTWLRHWGGYLGFAGHLPAGKLNAGQKLYFWIAATVGGGLVATGALMALGCASAAWSPFVYTLHDLLAIVLTVAAVGHIYLAVIANPGAMQAVTEGTVTESWARHHHPQWLHEPEQDGH